jgi:hypothetical protein
VRSTRILGRLAIAAPASIPALYAWGVTVAPVVWGRAHVPLLANLAAIAGPLILGVGVLFERRFGGRIRSLYLWAFTMACALCWASAVSPGDALLDRSASEISLDTTYAVAGVLAWGGFALSWAAPPLEAWADEPRAVRGVPAAAEPSPRGALVITTLGITVAVGLQLVSFDAKSAESALLLRLVSVAGGLVAIGAGAKSALVRPASRKR